MIQLTTDDFSDKNISSDTAAFNAKLAKRLAGLPATHELDIAQARAARDAGKGLFQHAGPFDGSEWDDRGPVRLRLSRPDGPARGIYFHIHGGGWTFGRPSHFDLYNQEIAKATGLIVLSVEYRLAPEHPWPLPLEDCLAGVRWVIENRALYADAGPLILGGDSAGAHLGACALIALRDAGQIAHVDATVLAYGCYDLLMTPSMRNWGEENLVLSTPTVEWFATNLCPGRHARAQSDISPLKADLQGLPPAFFMVGTADPLIDDSVMMAARWLTSGNQAELALFSGGVHGLDLFDYTLGHAFRKARIKAIEGFLAA